MDRRTFTTRLDPDLLVALDERRRLENRSRNWCIDQAVRAWLQDGDAATDDTPADEATDQPDTSKAVHKTQGDARAASAGTVPGAQPPSPRHLHRLTEEQPDTRRVVMGTTYATFACTCGKATELVVRAES